MNELGRTLLWSTVQVTVLSAGVAAVYAVVSRRRPATAVQVTTAGLAGCVLLTLVAFCPLPAWWTWLGAERNTPAAAPAGPSGKVPGASAADDAPSPGDDGGGLSWPSAWLLESLKRAGRAGPEVPGLVASGTTIFAAVFLAGAALGLGRLLAGLWLVGGYRRSSRPVVDPEIRGLADSLQSILGCRCVSLRECAGLTGPATAGWLRPVLLLPAGWREWDGEERRAVLAHEMAHVRRGDFAARVVAGLGVALHPYHPLLHWLSARLRLQQELAADALAAPLAGGRECYLRALARLALRADGPAPAWPAHAFFSSPRTLMRRVQMLRSKDGPSDRRTTRGALTAILVAGVLAASALRSPAREGAAEPPPAAKAQPAPAAEGAENSTRAASHKPECPPFDLTYIPPSARGVIAYRPAVLFGAPGMGPAVAECNKQLGTVPRAMGLKGDLHWGVEDIEQVTGDFIVEQRQDGHGSVQMALRSARTVKDFDWLKQMRDLLPGLTEGKEQGKTVYHIPGQALPFLGRNLTFTIPDGRTIAVLAGPGDGAATASGERMPALTGRPVWADDWQKVQRCAVALAYDFRGLDRVRERLGKDKDVDPALAGLFENVDGFVFGFDPVDGLHFECLVRGKDKETAQKIQKLATDWLGRSVAGSDGRAKEGKPRADEDSKGRLLVLLAGHSTVERTDNVVRWKCKLEMTLPELFRLAGGPIP
jgi:beta-lactamase regulating signal transducer with metallopeptidase domain